MWWWWWWWTRYFLSMGFIFFRGAWRRCFCFSFFRTPKSPSHGKEVDWTSSLLSALKKSSDFFLAHVQFQGFLNLVDFFPSLYALQIHFATWGFRLSTSRHVIILSRAVPLPHWSTSEHTLKWLRNAWSTVAYKYW